MSDVLKFTGFQFRDKFTLGSCKVPDSFRGFLQMLCECLDSVVCAIPVAYLGLVKPHFCLPEVLHSRATCCILSGVHDVIWEQDTILGAPTA